MRMPVPCPAISTRKEQRYHGASRFLLRVDGIGDLGTLHSVDGGGLRTTGSVKTSPGQPISLAGRPRYDDIGFTVGMVMAREFWGWLNASLAHRPERRNGSIVELDFDNRIRSELEFRDALLSEVGFPGLDAARAEPPLLSVKLAVESVRETVYAGPRQRERPEQESVSEGTKHQCWSTANFTLRVDRLADATQRTVRVAPFAIRQSIIELPTGGSLQVQKEPGMIEFPNIQVTLLNQDAAPWLAWYQELLEQGRADEETNGHLTFLARTLDQSRPLMTVHLFGVSLLGLNGGAREPGAAKLRQVTAELQCDFMRIEPHDLGAAGGR